MTRILFIGLGNMGRPVARHLLEAGHEVTVFDLDRERVASLVALGATAAETVRGASAEKDLICTLLPADRHVREAAAGADGFVGAFDPGTVFVDLSTIAPGTFVEVADAVARAGGRSFDVALGGGRDAAEAGTLTLIVGGDEDLVDAHRDLLGAFSSAVVHCGAPGAGKAVKLANNLVSAATLLLDAEAMLLAVAAGADPAKLVEVMQGTAACNVAATRIFPASVFSRTFECGFALELMRKDVALAFDMAAENGIPLRSGEAVLARLMDECEAGQGSRDVLAFVASLERETGLTLAPAGGSGAGTAAAPR